MTPTFARLLLWFLAGMAVGGCTERQHHSTIRSGTRIVTPTWDSDNTIDTQQALERAIEFNNDRRRRLRKQI